MPFELPADPTVARRASLTRWVTFFFAALLVALVAYFAYVAWEGSRQLADAPTNSTDCRTPEALGWDYEAINYDIDTDADLVAEDDVTDCTRQGQMAGDAVTGPGGIGLAGWYIPAGSSAGPVGPTVVIAHGWSSNKSDMLERAELLHDDYNLLIFDFRNHGQSQASHTTQGVREAGDLRAMLDWLETSKAPDQVAVLGVSMGGAAALNAAVRDDRIAAVVIESTHATLANAIQARLDRGGYPLSMPGSWAVLLGGLMRTGEDMSVADPVQAVEHLDERPVLIITGGQDGSIGRRDAEDLYAAATAAGSPSTLEVCEPAGHAQSPEMCPEDYGPWVLGFLEREMPPGG